MFSLSPVGLAAAPVANQLATLATFREKFCGSVCINPNVQPSVSYTYGAPTLSGSSVFVPITATIVLAVPAGQCSKPIIFVENFVADFQGQTALPTEVTITSLGKQYTYDCVSNGRAKGITIHDSITVSITPPAA